MNKEVSAIEPKLPTSIQLDPMDIGSYYFPVNLGQFETLVGKMLTHIESINLSPSVEKANKDLVKQSLWKWFSDIQENSLTSWKGCIGPIRERYSVPAEEKYRWHTDIGITAPTKDTDKAYKK